MRVFLTCLLISGALPVAAQTTAEDVARKVLEAGEPASAEPSAPVPPDTDTTKTDSTASPADTSEVAAPSPAPLPAPDVQVEIDLNDTLPGQPVSVRITVLVPTWLSKPVDFPTYDIPNVITRLSEGATSPTSATINGETWSGVTRRYRFIPMIDGDFTMPAEELVVLYADPDATDAIEARIPTEPIQFSATRPAGTEDMDPFIAAENLTLNQEITGTPTTLTQGGSFSRKISAKIEGTTPILLPQLLPETSVLGLSAYPKEPALTETDNRGTLSGTRSEEITYVAEGGLSAELPAITLDWYDLTAQKVQTASVEAISVKAEGPAITLESPPDLRRYGVILAALCGLGLLLAAYLKWAHPALQRHRATRRRTYLASDQYAFTQLREAVEQQDLSGALAALKRWETFTGAQITAPVKAALLSVGQAQYATDAVAHTTAVWQEVKPALDKAQKAAHSAKTITRHTADLPDLNPKAST